MSTDSIATELHAIRQILETHIKPVQKQKQTLSPFEDLDNYEVSDREYVLEEIIPPSSGTVNLVVGIKTVLPGTGLRGVPGSGVEVLGVEHDFHLIGFTIAHDHVRFFNISGCFVGNLPGWETSEIFPASAFDDSKPLVLLSDPVVPYKDFSPLIAIRGRVITLQVTNTTTEPQPIRVRFIGKEAVPKK